ncbi:hypothetical protein JZ751_018764 [Albula glossodonta]|uniref:DNA-directed RNA polymerases I and III subunit RPAC2 n=1 Tax=Albula glossodonta TaxID=121402 RepID=A0A8T2NRA4_9TELE|nr:hypothetical protein JZ751_018764 [Albula glossodonta]
MAGAEEKKAVLEMVQADGADEGCVTFVLHEEDHTLGNSLRYMIMKNPDVEFCGYSITHPSESKINFRIQTRGDAHLSQLCVCACVRERVCACVCARVCVRACVRERACMCA